MSFSVQNFIYIQELENGKKFAKYEIKNDYFIEIPYVVGDLQSFLDDKETGYKTRLTIVNKPFFNNAGIAKLKINNFSNGIYFIELREKYKISSLIIQPEEIDVDIYYNPSNRLIYSFYNNTKNDNITITVKIEIDKDDIVTKIKNSPRDIHLRKYFINITKEGYGIPIKEKPTVDNKSILTAEEAAKYLRIGKRTLQNYVSQGKIKALKGGKFSKEDLDKYLGIGSKKWKKFLSS